MDVPFVIGVGMLALIGVGGSVAVWAPVDSATVRKKMRLAWAALKTVVAILISPVLVALFFTSKERFLIVMTALWPHLDILGENKDLYLRRFFMTPKTQWFRPRFLHYIARSDEGREPHDHPGAFTTRILWNGYDEQVYHPQNQRFRDRVGFFEVREARVGDVLHNPVGHTHKVTLIGPTWSWVVGWIKGKPWGFWTLSDSIASLDRWVDSEEYGVKGDEVKSWT